MKHIFLVLFSICFQQLSFSQSVHITAVKNNVLYIGVENALTIAVDNKTAEDITIRAGDAEISYVSGNNYIVKVSKPGNVVISVADKKTNASLGTSNFDAMAIPYPDLHLKGAKDNKISRDDLRDLTKISAVLTGFRYDAKYKIDSCSLTLVRLKNGGTRDFFVTSAPFSEELIDDLKKLREGDLLLMRNVYVSGPEGLRRIPAAVFTITEGN